MEDSLKKRYFIKLFANIVNGLINMIIIAIVPKALGPVAYGQFAYIQQFFSKLIGLLDSGSSTAFFTKLSKDRKRIELIKFYSFYSFFLFSLMIISISLINYFDYLAYLFPDISSNYIYMGIVFGFLVWFTTIFIYISDAHALTVSVETIKIVHKIVSVLLLFVFVNYLAFDVAYYFVYNYITLFIFILLVIYLFIHKSIFSKNVLSISLNMKSLTKEFLSFSSPLLLLNIVSIIFGLFDIWLLQTMGGSEQTGFYSLAYGIAAMCFLFTSAMTPIITREFAKSYEEKDLKKIKSLFSKYIPMLYSIAAYFGVFISFQSENLLIIFTDENFLDAYLVLVVIAFYPIHQTYGQLSGSIFYVTEQTRLVRNVGIVSSLFGFALTVLFIYFLKLGAVGLAWKMVIIQIISVNIQLYFNSKFLKLRLFDFIYHQIVSLLFFVLIMFLTHFIMISLENKWIEFLLSGVIYTAFVTVGTLIMPSIFGLSRENIVSIKNIFRKKRI
ncbi:MAG: lipopolysaccharide biosynthesis protein [Campylobacterales bacterium]|nr:lipopolysaccharide biosynthesis protein [Campylobacterales bacterium]